MAEKKKSYRHKYGIIDDHPIKDPRKLEMLAFLFERRVDQGGLGCYEHFRRVATSALPKMEWNPWLVRQFQSLCSDEYAHRDGDVTIRSVNWTGCGAGGKTFSAGVFALLWFMVAPKRSAVTLVSSSKLMLRRRVWPVIQATHFELCQGDYKFGHMIDSQMMLQAEKGDSKHAIAGTAVQGGELAAAIENLKGLHAERILLIIDEAPGTPEAIFETIPNMRTGCQKLTVLTIGNAISHMDCHGRACEPRDGWSSINVNSDTWRTKGVLEWDLPSGRAEHFDGFKSPNVAAGKTIHPYMYTYEDYCSAKARSAERQTIQLWSQARGFWSPAGVLNTIFDEMMIEKYDAKGGFVWQSWFESIAALDTAFGGDNCVLQFGEYGDLANGQFAVQCKEWICIQADPTSKDEIDYQIARRVISECDKRRIRPNHFAADATGTGRGVFAILRQEWGECLRVEFGGSPSDKPASGGDHRPSNEVYDRRVSELWYSCREFLTAGQLKGLCTEAIIEFCSREYTMKTRKICLDTKEECKKKIGRSPDWADAACILVELARTLGAQAGYTEKYDETRSVIASKLTDLYDENDIATNDPIGDAA